MELRVYWPCLTTMCQHIKLELDRLTLPFTVAFKFVFSGAKLVFEWVRCNTNCINKECPAADETAPSCIIMNIFAV